MLTPHHLALPDTRPLLHFARRLDVVAWPLERVPVRADTSGLA